jgi:hypothetical protein
VPRRAGGCGADDRAARLLPPSDVRAPGTHRHSHVTYGGGADSVTGEVLVGIPVDRRQSFGEEAGPEAWVGSGGELFEAAGVVPAAGEDSGNVQVVSGLAWTALRPSSRRRRLR